MAQASRGKRGSSLTQPISVGNKQDTGGKFGRPSDPGDNIYVDANRESGPRLNPPARGKLGNK